MLNITFNGIKPKQNCYEYSIVGNAKVDMVRFVLQNDICSEYSLEQLSNFVSFVKVQSAGKEYIDKISALSSYDNNSGFLTIDLVLDKKTTFYKNIALQLQFEESNGVLVAQTEIVALTLKGNIKADEEIPDRYPSALQQIESELTDHEERIEALEEGGSGVNQIDASFSNDELNISIAKDSEEVDSTSVEIPLSNKVDKEEGKGLSSNDFTNEEKAKLDNDYSKDEIDTKFADIDKLIPAQASEENKLADKDFVNSSIATNTAYFKGTFNVVDDLGLTVNATHEQIATALANEVSDPTNNDYVFVSFPDPTVPTEYTKFSRYKYNSEDEEWAFEFDLNNSSFTANQWASINSGITAQMVSDMPQKSQNETITGQYTFENVLKVKNASYSPTFDIEVGNGRFDFKYGNISYLSGDANLLRAFTIIPKSNNLCDLGSNSYKWKEGFINKITDTKGSYSSDNVLNVINASDIVNNTLTQAQLDLITNGKPTLIKGTLRGLANPTLKQSGSESFGEIRGVVEYTNSLVSLTGIYSINTTTKVIQIYTGTGAKSIDLNCVRRINDKNVPNYPSSPTVPQVLIYDTDNTMKYTNASGFKQITYGDYQALSSNEKQALLDVGCQIIGTLSVAVGGGNVINPILFPRRNFGSYSQGIFVAGSSNKASTIGTWEQNHSATTLTIKVLFRGVDEKLTIQRLSNLNGASFPSYPSDASTKTYIPKLVNGAWLFAEEITFNFNTNFSNAQTNTWTEITDADDLALLADFRSLTKIPTKVSFSAGYQTEAMVLYHNVYQNQGTNFSFFLGNEGNKLTIQYQNDKWQYIKR